MSTDIGFEFRKVTKTEKIKCMICNDNFKKGDALISAAEKVPSSIFISSYKTIPNTSIHVNCLFKWIKNKHPSIAQEIMASLL